MSASDMQGSNSNQSECRCAHPGPRLPLSQFLSGKLFCLAHYLSDDSFHTIWFMTEFCHPVRD
jgi:hypothetical protein